MEWGDKQPGSGVKPDVDSHLLGDTSPNTAKITGAEENTSPKQNRHTFNVRMPKLKLSSGSNGGRFGQVLRRYWYLIVLIILIGGALIGWQMYKNHIDTKWSKATDYYGKADYTKAAKELEGVGQPKEEDRLKVYAQTKLATRDLDASLPAYSALYDQKKDPSVKLIIGNIYNEQKKYDEAAKTYRELIVANKGYVQAYVNLSTLNKLQGKSQDAVAVAKQGVEANPKSVVLYELLISMLLENKNTEDYKKAVATLKKLNPQDPIFEAIKE